MVDKEGKKTFVYRLAKEEIIRRNDKSFLEDLTEEDRRKFLMLDTAAQKKFILKLYGAQKN